MRRTGGAEPFSCVMQTAFDRPDGDAEPRRNVRLRFENILANVVIDRFGKEIILAPDGEDHFTVNVEVSVSPQFMAWVFGLGSGVEILSPADVRNQMKERLAKMLTLYQE
mgnify:CR=1 FL=1